MKQAQHQPQPQNSAHHWYEQIAHEPRRDLAPAGGSEPKIYVPGWPARGRFSKGDFWNIAGGLPMLTRYATELIYEEHFYEGSPAQARADRLRGLAFDMLSFLWNCLWAIVDAPATPIFRVAHAELLERGYDLPGEPEAARRALERIKAVCRGELRAAPEKLPGEAGPACRAHPVIAGWLHGHRGHCTCSTARLALE